MMPWWGWTILGVAVYVPIWRVSFRTMWKEEISADWGAFWGCALIATFLFWLLALVVIADFVSARYKPDQLARVVGGESRASKRKRRERELREREEKVAQLERELGIGG